MEAFSEAELAYLHGEGRLARIATVGRDGTPHVAPVGWSMTGDHRAVEVRGINLTATKKFRDVARPGRAALVIEGALPPWQPAGRASPRPAG